MRNRKHKTTQKKRKTRKRLRLSHLSKQSQLRAEVQTSLAKSMRRENTRSPRQIAKNCSKDSKISKRRELFI